MGFIEDAIANIDNMLKPLAPAGVGGIAFAAVFLLIYGIIFAGLELVHFLGPNKRGLRAIISLVAAYFTSTSTFATVLISKVFPNLGIAVVGIAVFLIIVGLVFGSSRGEEKKLVPYLIILGFIGFVVWNAWNDTAIQLTGEGLQLPNLGSQEWGLIIFVIIFLAIILIITGVGGGEGDHSVFKGFKDIISFPWFKGK